MRKRQFKKNMKKYKKIFVVMNDAVKQLVKVFGSLAYELKVRKGVTND